MPATKLSHYVCSSTSEDHEHPAKELDQQAPHSRGWRSRQFCIYPQEIAFQLGTRAHISRVQVLLHQLLIPERIDFFVGDVERGSDETYANARFVKLGYVSLAPPDEGGGKAREFKSVAVDCEGRFIKLVIHRNHMTKINKFNQVSIMGVNFLGDEKEPNNNSAPEPRTGSAPLTHDGISTYDDLAFNMYTDADSVKHIRKLEARKTDAVKNERYNYAQNCKLATELLQRAGLRLGKYDIEKRLAIEEENYDKAKQKKDHIEEYREAVHEALKVKQLMEEDGANSNNDLIMHLTLPPPPGKKKRPPTPPPKTPPRPQSDPLPPIPQTSEPPQPSVKKPLTPPPPIFTAPRAKTPPAAAAYNPGPEAVSPVPPRSTFTPSGPGAAAWSPPAGRRSKPQNKYALYEDRTLPAIRGKRLAAQAGIIMPEQDNPNKSPNLTDEDRKEASLPIEVFGEPLVGSFYARAFAEKEEGLRGLLASLKDDDGTVKADKKTRAATMLLQRTLKDKVYTVCQLGTETLDYLVGPFAAKRKTSRRELSSTIEAVTPELIHKTGDNATRVQTLAVDTLLRLADVAHARQIPAVATALTAPIQGNNVQTRVVQTRLEVVEMIVVKHGVSEEPDSAMSVKHLTEFALSAIEHASDGVRAAGSRLLILIYPDNPKLVRKMLPPNDKKSRKSLTYRTLFEELDKLDGEVR